MPKKKSITRDRLFAWKLVGTRNRSSLLYSLFSAVSIFAIGLYQPMCKQILPTRCHIACMWRSHSCLCVILLRHNGATTRRIVADTNKVVFCETSSDRQKIEKTNSEINKKTEAIIYLHFFLVSNARVVIFQFYLRVTTGNATKSRFGTLIFKKWKRNKAMKKKKSTFNFVVIDGLT